MSSNIFALRPDIVVDTKYKNILSYVENELHLDVLFFDLSRGFEQDIGLKL